MSAPVLAFQVGGGEEIVFTLEAGESTLGRSDENSIVIENSWISARHAKFDRAAGGTVTVTDLDSHNGVEVNGERVTKRELKHLDRLGFGQVEAEFRCPSASSGKATGGDASAPPKPKGEVALKPKPAPGSSPPKPAGTARPAPDRPVQPGLELERVRAELAAAKATLAKLESERGAGKKALDEARAETTATKAELAGLRKELEESHARTKAKAKPEASRANAKADEPGPEKLERQQEDEAAELLRKRELAAEIEAAEAELSGVKKRAADARAELESLASEARTKRDAIAAASAEIKKLEGDRAAAEKRRGELDTATGELEMRRAAAETRQAALASEIEALGALLADSTKERDSLIDEVAALAAKRQATESEIESLLTSAADVREHASQARDHLSEVSSAISELELRQASLEDSCRELESRRSAALGARSPGGGDPSLPAALAQLDTVLEEKRRAVVEIDELTGRLQELREQRDTLEAAPDLDWGTVHVLSKRLIKKIDLLDDLIASQAGEPAHRDLVAQLEVFKQSLLDVLKAHSVEPFGFAPGTELDLGARKRILVVGSPGGTNGAGAGTGDAAKGAANGTNGSSTVLATLRPGYFCSNGPGGSETLLRKAEVKTA